MFAHIVRVKLLRCTLNSRAQKIIAVTGIAVFRSRLGNKVEVPENGDCFSRGFVFFDVLFYITVDVMRDAA